MEAASSPAAPAAEQPAAAACQPVVLCGPSGVGKSTLIARLRAAHPGAYGFSVSHTTRSPRPGETHGKDYFYVTTEDFASKVAAGAFLEHATVHGRSYGTSWAAVAAVSDTDHAQCLLDIDVQGVRAARALPPPGLQALCAWRREARAGGERRALAGKRRRRGGLSRRGHAAFPAPIPPLQTSLSRRRRWTSSSAGCAGAAPSPKKRWRRGWRRPRASSPPPPS